MSAAILLMQYHQTEQLWCNYVAIMVQLCCNYGEIMVQLWWTWGPQIQTEQSACDTNILVKRRKVSELTEQGNLTVGIDYNYS